MAKLKVPSLQHLARLSSPDPVRVQRELVRLVKNAPNFSYEPLYKILRQRVSWNISWAQLQESIRLSSYSAQIKARYLDILPLLKSYVDSRDFEFMNTIVPRHYYVSRDLQVPFAPPMICGKSSKLIFPWFIFWKDNPLKDERLSLFATLVQEILNQDSDLEEAEVEIVDLSYNKEHKSRILDVVQMSAIPCLAESRKVELLATFATGFAAAKAELASIPSDRDAKQAVDRRQRPLF